MSYEEVLEALEATSRTFFLPVTRLPRGLPEAVARQMTSDAGFTRFTVHDFGNPLNSFYEVRP